jgi:NADH-quinone oxidoreductase subunit M
VTLNVSAYGPIVSTGLDSGQRAFPYLTALVLVPAGAALLVLLLPRARVAVVRAVGFAACTGVLGIAAAVLDEFRSGYGGYQMMSEHPWVGAFGFSWTLGVDGISLFLVLMTAVLFPVALASGMQRRDPKSFTFWVLLLESACLGSFLSVDLLLFFLFFEATLVPVYMLVAGWGHERRGYAAAKFFVYTFAASAFMLVGILALVFIHQSQTGVTTFDIRQLANTRLSGPANVLLFCAFTAALAVKAPVFPFHTWSPDAYSEAPAAGSVLLAGVMAKLGTYGIIRFDLGLFPHAVVELAPVLLTLGVIGIIYGGIVAAVQKDLKRLVAFSSLAHIGFIVVGLFALTGESLSGAVIQMVNHGLYTAALFILIAMIYERLGTFQLPKLRGLQHSAPVMAGVFTLVMLASIGVPGLNGFVGEFLILSGAFLTHRWWAVVATGGVVVAAVYLLWAYQQAFHGRPLPAAVSGGSDGPIGTGSADPGPPTGGAKAAPFREMTWREGLVLAPLVVLIVLLGVYPRPVLERITPTVNQLVLHAESAAHARIPALGRPGLTSYLHVAGAARTQGAER